MDDIPFNKPLATFDPPVADGHLVALGDEPADAAFGRMMRHAAHGDAFVRVVAPPVPEVSVSSSSADAVRASSRTSHRSHRGKREYSRNSFFYFKILPHHRCDFGHGVSHNRQSDFNYSTPSGRSRHYPTDWPPKPDIDIPFKMYCENCHFLI